MQESNTVGHWGLRYKIFALMGSLILGLLVATLLVVGLQVNRAARHRVVTDLHRTRQQFEALQQLRYQSLLALSHILSREYALRNAVSTYDAPTILSAIQSFQSRIQSDVFFVVDNQGGVLASIGGGQHLDEALARHSARQHALAGEEALHIWQVQSTLYQVVTAPLTIGPDLLGTLGIGYAIDQSVLQALQTITGSALTVLSGDTILASTWPVALHPALARALEGTGWVADASALSQVTPDEVQTLSMAGETYLSLAIPLVDPQQRPVGVYLLQKSLDQELAPLRHMQRMLLGTGVIALGVALAVSFFMAHGITAPVQALVEGAAAVGHGDYQYRVAVRSQDELGVLARAYNTMTEQLAAHITELQAAYRELQQQTQALEASLRKVELLEKIQTHLGKFVPASVKRLIETAPEAPALEKQDRDVTVLFLDIAGYTRLSEHTSRVQMNALVERYFSSFLDAIYTHHGDINETAGDGLMILFQDDDPVQHAINAVSTALAIQQQVHALNHAMEPTEPVTINIGINSGLAAVGSTRFEGLTGARWTYTASGPVTNLAELATHGDIYLGEETAVRVKPVFPLRELGKRHVKNVQEPIAVYTMHLNHASQRT